MKPAFVVTALLDGALRKFFVLAINGIAAINKVLDTYGYAYAARSEFPEINQEYFKLLAQAEQHNGCILITE